jgi:hypothetical protein
MNNIVRNIGFKPIIVCTPIAALIGLLLYAEHPSMNANVSSVKNLNHCGQSVVSDLIKTHTGKLATISEVNTARQICSDIAADRILLTKAKTNNNHYLIGAYTHAINNSKPRDIAKRIYYAEHGGIIYHVYSHYYRNTFDYPRKYRTIYYVYSPEAIMSRYNSHVKYAIKKNKIDAELKTEE